MRWRCVAAGEWKASEMDVELKRRLDEAVSRSGGWVVEANPWQVPLWVWAEPLAEVLWLDYHNLVNYQRLLRRGVATYASGVTLPGCGAPTLAGQIANAFELIMIVYKWGEENRSGWRAEERFRPPRAVRFETPAECERWLAALREAVAAG